MMNYLDTCESDIIVEKWRNIHEKNDHTMNLIFSLMPEIYTGCWTPSTKQINVP